MPMPDKHADEPTVELDPHKWALYEEYMRNAKAWMAEAVKLKAEIMADMGDATAALVAGQRVATYRAASNYAEAQLQKDYSALTVHYTHQVTKDVFDMELFAKAHPDIAEKYRVRQFRVGTEEG